MSLRSLALLLICCAGSAWAQQEFAVTADGKRLSWGLIEHAAKPWRLCALLPHGRDKYWWGVAWGLAQEGRRLKLDIGIYQANSYADLPLQRKQWADCEAAGAQAFILAAISADGFGAEIARARAAGKPVIDLINGVDDETTSRSLVSFADMAHLTAEYLLQHAAGARVSAAWFPGPADAGWVHDGERGLMDALSGKPVQLRLGGRGPTDSKSQATLVRTHLAEQGMPDYLIGNAVAVEFAARLLAQRGYQGRVKLLAYYATEEVVARIASGEVLAAPTDQPIVQARIAVDLAVRALEGQKIPKRVSPSILMIDAQSLRTTDLSRLLPPKGQGMIQQALPPAAR